MSDNEASTEAMQRFNRVRRVQREQKPRSAFVFTSERGAPFSSRGVHKLIALTGVAAGLSFPTHPHMLRHACGYMCCYAGQPTAQPQETNPRF